MEITARESWTVLHGMVFGASFLIAFAGGLAGLYSLRPEWITVKGIQERMARLKIGMWAMALVAWATVISGTFIVNPTIVIISMVLLVVGLLGTFPPFFELFVRE